VPALVAVFGSVYQWRKRIRNIEEKKGRTLVRRNSEVKLTDGMDAERRALSVYILTPFRHSSYLCSL
jgi:hypothetical protein